MLRSFIFVVLGYISGSVLYAKVFGRFLKKEDILQNSRDHNPGVANAFQYGGFLYGTLTLCGDLLKGFLPIWLFSLGLSEASKDLGLALVLAAPVIGHDFPVFYGFQGGKGIAVTFGCLLGLLPYGLPLELLAAFFIFLSLGLRITPHFYRSIAAYICTLSAMIFLRVKTAVCIGFLIITGTVCLRFFRSKEEKEKPKVRLLWMH